MKKNRLELMFLIGIPILLVIALASFEVHGAGEKSWLGVLNHWLLDSDWDEQVYEDAYILSKASLTNDSLILMITCGRIKPTLAVMIVDRDKSGMLTDDIKLSFDDGPQFKDVWTIHNQNALGYGGDVAMGKLHRLLTSNVLLVNIEDKNGAHDKFTFYLEGMRKFKPHLDKYCQWRG